MRYYDLVNLICIRERDLLGEQLTIELYSCEGYPLATYPGAYVKNLTSWCLEAYDDTQLLHAIPRPKLYTDKQTLHTTAKLPKGKYKLHLRTIGCTVKTNCNTGTYYQLCNTIQDITGIPMHLIQIKMNNELILEKDQALSALNIPITNDSVIEFVTSQEFWESLLCNNFSSLQYHPTWYNQQSVFGTSQFFSCLYSLSDWMYNQNTENIRMNTLGYLRNITGCPPLIHSLYLLFSKQIITLPHQVAITEVMIQLFKSIKPKQYKEKGFKGDFVQDCEVTEYTNLFWTHFITRAVDNHGNTECFETVNLINDLKCKKMETPLTVTNQFGQHIIDKASYKGKNIDAELNYNYKRLTTSFLSYEAVVWKCVQMYPLGVELTQEWEQLKQEVKRYPPLCIQAPLQVRSIECTPPAMIPIDDSKVATYIGDAKDGSRKYIYFDVLTGQETQFDVDILDKEIKRNPPKILDILKRCDRNPQEEMGKLTRDPVEVTLVLLDISDSMKSAFENGKTRRDAVIEAFIAFSDRTNAYELKHAIGLVIFTNDCTLHYPISENIKDFSDKFSSLPVGGTTAIYSAINFAIEKFNEFDCTYPQYSQVPKRILCLSDGEDNSSKLTPEQVTNMLIKNKIIMDTVLLSDEVTYSHYIAKASGGYSFGPKSCPELLAIFENEPMLTLRMRRNIKPLLSPCDDGDPRLSQSKEEWEISRMRSPSPYHSIGLMFHTVHICSGWLTDGISSIVDKEIDHIFPDQLGKPAITMHKCLTFAMRQKYLGKTVYNASHTKRLLQELAYYANDRHESFKIYPCEESIDFWQLILFGPKYTSYEDGIFHLFIEFTDKYPSKPPNIRFITPIYHCNINQAGKVCHSILDRFYSPGIRIRQILDYVYGLLMDPAPDDPLDTVKATELKFNHDLYMNNAIAYTAKHAKQYKTAIDLQKIILKGNDDNCEHDVEYVCPLTGELFVDAWNTKEGDSYEKEAILAHIRNVGEYDPFSYAPLKEEDLSRNKALQRLVNIYREDIANAAKMK